jgi:hypothetical protein
LDGMKDVVRKKLGLSTSIPVHLSQIRDGKSVDLEDGLSRPAHSYNAKLNWLQMTTLRHSILLPFPRFLQKFRLSWVKAPPHMWAIKPR